MQNTLAILQHRPIQPRAPQPLDISIQRLSIQKLSITHIGNQNLLTIHPSGVCIGSRQLLAMAQEKREFVQVGLNSCLRRHDLLSSAETLLQHTSERVTEKCISSNRGMDVGQRKAAKAGPKRPSNAFMLYSSSLRKKIKTLFPEYSNSEISKLLGAMWHAASKDVKKKYMQKADEVRMWHKAQYPNYEYNVRKPLSLPPTSKKQGETVDAVTAETSWIDQLNDILSTQPLPHEPATGHQLPLTHNETPVISCESYRMPPPMFSEMSTPGACLFNSSIVDGSHSLQPNEWNEICNTIAILFPEFSSQGFHLGDAFLDGAANPGGNFSAYPDYTN